MQRNWGIFVVFLLVLAHRLYATNGMFPIFMGGQAAGRGGADFAVATDPTCINTNPAGIAFLRGKMIEFSVGSFFPSIEFSSQIDRVRADFEPIPFGSFGVVFDEIGQTFQATCDPFVSLFGGKPILTDYAYFSKGYPVPASGHSRNHGHGVLELSVDRMPGPLVLEARGKGASLSSIRAFGHVYPAERKVFFQKETVPSLPHHAQITSISVSFRWKCGERSTSPPQVVLEAESEKEVLSLQNEPGKWHSSYLALVWSRSVPPASVVFSAPLSRSPFELADLTVTLGYRIGKSYHWTTLHQEKNIVPVKPVPEQRLLWTNDAAYSVEDTVRVELKGMKSFPEEGKSGKIRIHYEYTLAPDISGRFLNVSLSQGQKVVDRREHLFSFRESERESVPTCYRSADHENIAPERESGLKFGFGIFPQAGARYSMEFKTADYFPEGIENRTDLIFVSIAPAIAYRFGNRFSLGVALNVNFERLEMDGLISQDSEILRGKVVNGYDLTYGEALIELKDVHTVRGEVDMDYLYGVGVGGRIGLLWKITDRLQFGAMYSSQTWMMDAKGKGKVDFTRHFNDPNLADLRVLVIENLPNRAENGIINRYDLELEFNLPQRVGAGISYMLLDNLMFAADFQWIDYSHTQFKLKAKLRHGKDPDFNTLAGADSVTAVFNVGWKDQYVVSTGLVWQPSSCWILRAGYNYGNNPVPKEYLNPQLAAITEHHVTMGLSYMFSRSLSIHAAVECALPSRLKSGAINKADENYANSELEFFLLDVVMGATLRF